MPLSNGNAILGHLAYQKIIELGKPTIPVILKKLKVDCYHFFYALFKITGENPVPKKDAGYPKPMAEHWLKWGQKRNYISI